jgi:hypothetical protein
VVSQRRLFERHLIGLNLLRPPMVCLRSAAEPRGPHFGCWVFEASLTPPVSSLLINISLLESHSSRRLRLGKLSSCYSKSSYNAGFRLPLGGRLLTCEQSSITAISIGSTTSTKPITTTHIYLSIRRISYYIPHMTWVRR